MREILDRAFVQASAGKGRDRHARDGVPFDGQPIVQLGLMMGGSTVFNIGQACKKSIESLRLDRGGAVSELLGAIVYLAGAVVILEQGAEQEASPPSRPWLSARAVALEAMVRAAEATGDMDAARVAAMELAELKRVRDASRMEI